jgi:hypothetical protein
MGVFGIADHDGGSLDGAWLDVVLEGFRAPLVPLAGFHGLLDPLLTARSALVVGVLGGDHRGRLGWLRLRLGLGLPLLATVALGRYFLGDLRGLGLLTFLEESAQAFALGLVLIARRGGGW